MNTDDNEIETALFDTTDVADDLDVLSILQSKPELIERFFDALRQLDRETFAVTISYGGRTYTLRDSGPGAVTRLAAEFVGFSPEREAKREQARIEEQRTKERAERAVAERQNTLVKSLLGGAL